MLWTSLVAQIIKSPPAMQETWVRSLGREDPLEEGMGTHSSTLACRIPWTEEPGRLQSTRSQNRTQLKQLSTSTAQHTFLLFVALHVYLLVYFLRHGLNNMMLRKD